jgi:EAL domain-containing protein (putative c-di-GMP-specific phosphodiesterase class I)/FixJ family two-component response regulator
MSDFGYQGRPKRRVLVVDDEEVNREILGNILGTQYEVSYAENGRQAYDMLHERLTRYSLILLDLLMPEMDGFELLEKIKSEEAVSNIPVIVMTSEKPAEVRSIKMGADDFITKPYDMPEVILARCERIIQLYEDKSIIRSAEKDDLTDLYTREFFQEYIRQIDGSGRGSQMDAIVLNIEHFHMLNEMFGRKTGDSVLKKIADMVTNMLGEGVCIGCRPDADYFYFYLEHRDSYDEVFKALSEELSGISKIPGVRMRLGVYQNVDTNISIEDRFDHAKYACDRIRGDYNRQISFYSKEENEKDLYHEQLINDIDNAISNRDLVVFYQPKYGIQCDEPELRSAEALIRWRHPKYGMISPGDFIPLFESNGLIQKLDHFVWEEAARQIRKWKDEYGITVPVSVNVSRVDIYDAQLEDRLVRILKDNDLDAKELMLEITESAYADDAKGLTDVVTKLRESGFRIEMDDFGSGYSSLNMITEIPIDVLKMDMKFIRNMNKDAKSLKLVELVIEIADYLGVPVVAEGVEDKSQVDQLKSMGCELIQGYYFSKPVPPEEFNKFIEAEISKGRESN